MSNIAAIRRIMLALSVAVAFVTIGLSTPAASFPLPASGSAAVAADVLSPILPAQCRQVYTTVPYCVYRGRYLGTQCGRRGVWRTVCSTSRCRYQRYCYQTRYRGRLCETRRICS